MTRFFALRVQPYLFAVPLVLAIAALLSAMDCAAAAESAGAVAHEAKVKLLVLDLEIVGDLSDPELERVHAARLREVSEQLRRELAQIQTFRDVGNGDLVGNIDRPAYEIVDATPAAEMIERLRGAQYLHKCNGCEIDIAMELGADQVMVAWIHRVSQLILSLTYEIREVPSGRPLRRKSFDFRGDNDMGWSRAVSYMARDLANAQRR